MIVLQGFPVNLEWDNLFVYTPENTSLRPYWYKHVHWPTRVAVQRAFENGVEDFRTVIEEEYRLLKEQDKEEGKRLAFLERRREAHRKGHEP